MNWEIKKIKNKNSNYDFRLIPSKKNDYSEINFFKTLIVKFSSTNKTRFAEDLFKLLF